MLRELIIRITRRIKTSLNETISSTDLIKVNQIALNCETGGDA